MDSTEKKVIPYNKKSIAEDIRGRLKTYAIELNLELKQILSWWLQFAVDKQEGGCYGTVTDENRPDPKMPKGLVLHSRVLWTFAAAYRLTREEHYIQEAHRVYTFLHESFIDKENGGMYWSVTYDGKPHESKKQTYGLAFAIYGLAEYYKIHPVPAVLNEAKLLFTLIEKYAFDTEKGGYAEALSANWTPIEDNRLSEKEINGAKTMNTHLHVIEAYANLYTVWENPALADRIKYLLDLFNGRIIDTTTNRQVLFFSKDWQPLSRDISYGHDIEAAWLLQESAAVVKDPFYNKLFQEKAIAMAAAAKEGIDTNDGGMFYEYEAATNHMNRQKHWWPQAEAMVGFFNAWEIAGDKAYLQTSLRIWDYIKTAIQNKQFGEWYWGREPDGSLMQAKDKAGFWKCPYHNGRSCMELLQRIQKYL